MPIFAHLYTIDALAVLLEWSKLGNYVGSLEMISGLIQTCLSTNDQGCTIMYGKDKL